MKWRPISKAPKDGRGVVAIGHYPDGGVNVFTVKYRHDPSKPENAMGDNTGFVFTHWLDHEKPPLPEEYKGVQYSIEVYVDGDQKRKPMD